MNERIEYVAVLSERQKKEIVQLLDYCKSKDGLRPDFFMEQEWNEIMDCPCFFLLYQERLLICAVSVFLLDGEAELSAVTRLESRGRGFLSKVMKEVFFVLEKYKIWTVIFRIESRNNVARKILEHWKFQKVQTDYLMTLLPEDAWFWRCMVEDGKRENKEQRVENRKKQEQKKRERKKEGEVKYLKYSETVKMKRELALIHASAFGCSVWESEWFFESSVSEGMELWGYWIEKRIIGLCLVSVTEQEYFFSAISICKEEQRKGYGENFLQRLLLCLWERERKAVFLQVSGENNAAVQLYKKLGFSVRQQLMTYFSELPIL